jgi:type III secretion system low calcium response chaperone LcrH/SycD
MPDINEKSGIGAAQISEWIEAEILTKEHMKLKEKDIQRIYAKAKHLYDSGKYQEAQALFSFLCLLERKTPSFLYGLASSSMMLNNLDFAIEVFLNYANLVKVDPIPYFYLSICYEKKNDIPSALICLQTLVTISGDQPQYQAIKNRALMAISHFSKKSDASDQVKAEKKS